MHSAQKVWHYRRALVEKGLATPATRGRPKVATAGEPTTPPQPTSLPATHRAELASLERRGDALRQAISVLEEAG